MKVLSLLYILCLTFGAQAAEYIVRGQGGMSAFSFKPAIQQLTHLNAKVMELSATEASALARQGFQIERNELVHTFALPNTGRSVSLASPQTPWYLTAIRATDANNLEHGSGEGIAVCIVDSGLDSSLPDLSNVVTGGINIMPDQDKNELGDTLGHGTALAALIAGRGVQSVLGVAPKAGIYVVKIMGSDGSSTMAMMAEGIMSCIGHAQVINLSLGSFTESQIVKEALDEALKSGLTVIAAAGNEPDDIAFPARYKGVIAIGSIGIDLKLSEFSARGPEMGFLAPGGDLQVLQPGGGVVLSSGTSYSTALASGVAAIRFARGSDHLVGRTLGLTKNEEGGGLLDAYLTATSASQVSVAQ